MHRVGNVSSFCGNLWSFLWSSVAHRSHVGLVIGNKLLRLGQNTQTCTHTSQIFIPNLRLKTCKQEITEASTYFSRITRLSVCVVCKPWQLQTKGLAHQAHRRMNVFLAPIFVFPQSFSHYFFSLIFFPPYSSFSFSCLWRESQELALN